MNGLPYYKAYPRDFFEGTVGMAFEVKAVYRLLLDLIYMHGGHLPDDPRFISGHLGCSVRAWNGYRATLASTGKITAENGIISNFRADKELETSGSFQEKQRKNASKSCKNKRLGAAMAKPKVSHTDTDTEREETEANASAKKIGSRLPADWRLPKALGDWAVSQGMSEAEARQEADKFRDYWIGIPGKGGVKLDWSATWRNWVRKAIADRSRIKPFQKSDADMFGAFGRIREVH